MEACLPGNLRERIRLAGPTIELPATTDGVGSRRNVKSPVARGGSPDMYIYDEFDRTLVAERVSEFADRWRDGCPAS